MRQGWALRGLPESSGMDKQFRWENFNFFNNTNLGQPVAAVDSSIAGRIVSLQGSLQGAGPGVGGLATMRRMQFGLRMNW